MNTTFDFMMLLMVRSQTLDQLPLGTSAALHIALPVQECYFSPLKNMITTDDNIQSIFKLQELYFAQQMLGSRWDNSLPLKNTVSEY